MNSGLPMLATRALVLKTQLGSDGQHAQHTKTSAREGGAISGASAVVVQWSICLLTLVELDMLSAAD